MTVWKGQEGLSIVFYMHAGLSLLSTLEQKLSENMSSKCLYQVELFSGHQNPKSPLGCCVCSAEDEGTMSAWLIPHHGGHITPPHTHTHYVKNLIRSTSHVPMGTIPREVEHTHLLNET